MEGGELLGQGWYGCVVSTPLPCKYPQFIPNASARDTTKISREVDLEEEVRVSNILREIPFARNYFIILKGSPCQPSTRSLEVEPDLKKCDIVVRKGLDTLKAVRMDYGGTALHYYRIRPASFDLWAFGTRMLEAGVILVTHGIVHCDLHQGNVLMDNYGIPRIIDFGLAIIKKYVSGAKAANDLTYSYDPTYVQQPPELSLFHAALDKRSIASVLPDIIQKKRTSGILNMVLGVTTDDLLADLTAFSMESTAFQKISLLEYWEHYWSKFDAWSIGVILLQVMNNLLKVGYDSHPSYKKYRVMMRRVIGKLLCHDPRSRYDTVEALAEWNPESVVLSRFGKPWLAKKPAA
jgi:serine/threonine protein kinase